MKLKSYEFQTKQWPPSKNLQNQDSYLFGFDIDNQPYIMRWETFKSSEGWCANTLENEGKASAMPRYFGPKDTARRIVVWAEAPLLKSVAKRLSAKAA